MVFAFPEGATLHQGRFRTAADFRRAAAGIFVDDANLLKTLERLDSKVFGKVIRSATNKAMTPVLKDARRNVKSENAIDSGVLLRSLGKKNKAYKRAAAQVSLVGPRRGFRQKVLRRQTSIPLPARQRIKVANPVNYAHLVEGGHRGRGRTFGRRGRMRPGRVEPKPFLEPALRRNRRLVENELRGNIGSNIIREWSKASSGGV